jgi:hypothetical protein
VYSFKCFDFCGSGFVRYLSKLPVMNQDNWRGLIDSSGGFAAERKSRRWVNVIQKVLLNIIIMEKSIDCSDGLWSYICRHSPLPEKDEIEHIIGGQVIDKNKVSLR